MIGLEGDVMINMCVMVFLTLALGASLLVPTQQSADMNHEGLVGSVRAIQIDQTRLSGNKSATTQELDRVPWRKVSFDTQGRKTEEVIYTSGIPTFRTTYAYDNVGRKIEEIEYRQGSRLFSRSITVHGARGNIVSETRYNAENAVVGRWVYNYGSNGKVDKVVFYNQLGEEGGKKTFSYDEKGGKIEESEGLHSRGTAHKRISVYNNNGYLTKVDAFDPDGILLDRVTFKYDAVGNLIEDSRYDSKGRVSSRSVLSYDSQKRLISREEYAANGSLHSALRYEYEVDSYGNWTRRVALKRSMNSEVSDSQIIEVIYRSITYY
jgi:hypothetical protein